MFNDRYGLTDAVIDYIKNNTRRIEGGEQFQRAATSAEDFTYEEATGCIVMCCQGIEIFRHKCRYKVGEVVAVAQSYYHAFSPRCDIPVYGADRTPGWRNKLFVRADLMPHQIRITGIKCEQWFIAEEAKAWVNQGLYAPIGSFEKCLLEHRVGIPARKATVEEIIEHFKKREK